MADRKIICDCDTIHTGVVENAKSVMPDDTLLFNLADFFKVFGDSTRIRILCALEVNEMCVCDMAELLSMTKSAISHQLRSLRQAKLVKYRRSGKNVFYSLDDEHVGSILGIAKEHILEDKARKTHAKK